MKNYEVPSSSLGLALESFHPLTAYAVGAWPIFWTGRFFGLAEVNSKVPCPLAPAPFAAFPFLLLLLLFYITSL